MFSDRRDRKERRRMKEKERAQDGMGTAPLLGGVIRGGKAKMG